MKEDRFYLLHIRDAIERILEYTSTGRDMFMRDRKTQDAVIRNIGVIGEAVKQLSPAAKSRTDLPWRRIAGMRDKVVHEYFGVDLDLVWEVVGQHLPKLNDAIESLLRDSANRNKQS